MNPAPHLPRFHLASFGLVVSAVLSLQACSGPAPQPSHAPTAAAHPGAPSTHTTAAMTSSPKPEEADPFLWLEEVQGAQALEWVKARSAQSQASLSLVRSPVRPGQPAAGNAGDSSANTSSFDSLRQDILSVLDSREQIPTVSRKGQWLYNLWRDASHPRGLWRRTTLEGYRQAQPPWEVVLDIDALGQSEGQSWVWAGSQCLAPSYARCLISLSPGGSDAAVVREFDIPSRRFIPASEGGFSLPLAKTHVQWLDANTVLVGTDFGPGSLTESGYPRQVKRWRRNQALAQAELVQEGKASEVGLWASVDPTPGFERVLYTHTTSFYRSTQVLEPAAGKPVKLPKPEDASLSLWRERVLITLRSDWLYNGQRFAAGALLIGNLKDFLAGKGQFSTLFTPTASRSLQGYSTTKDAVLVTVSEHVVGKLEEWRLGAGGGATWTRREVAAPSPGTLSASALHDATQANDPWAEHYLLNSADFLSPDRLMLGRAGSDHLETLKSRPHFFDSQGMQVQQYFARSADGTAVPYFVVWPKGSNPVTAKPQPTLLYGYGGFEVAMTPWYSGGMGRAWLSRGGVFVLANIRGGGEYGPAWHQAALRANKQKSYEDFAAVAQDLIAKGITTPAQLGMQGGSNGGLLVSAVMLQRPELFGAVVCQVPLTDMRRYHRLLAGASWMAEYGDPDKAEDWAFISRYSPYQNVPQASAGKPLPQVLLVTSTRDDRVHPGHARKLAARLQEKGHRVLYWENMEGGHGGAADNGQRATMMALEYSFLWQALGGAK